MTYPAKERAPALSEEPSHGTSGQHRIPAGHLDFETLYRAHFAFVWRTLRSRGIRDASLDDAVQEVFLVVLRRGEEFEGRASVKTWLYAICVRVAANVRRSLARREDRNDPESEVSSTLPGPDQRAQSEQAVEFVASFMEELEEEKRAIFQLAILEGMSAKEVAEITGANVNTVYTRMRWVKQAFRLKLQERASK